MNSYMCAESEDTLSMFLIDEDIELSEKIEKEEGKGSSASKDLKILKKKIQKIIQKRKKIIIDNIDFSECIRKSAGIIDDVVMKKFPELSIKLNKLTYKIHKHRYKYNIEKLKQKKARREIAHQSSLMSGGNGKVFIRVWIDRESGLIEYFGGAKDTFANANGELLGIPNNLERVSVEVELRTGKITGVHAASIFAKSRLKVLIGEVLSMGLEGKLYYWSSKEDGKLIETKEGWEVIVDEDSDGHTSLIAVRGSDWLELGEHFQEVIVRPDVMCLASEGFEPIIQEIFHNGRYVGSVSYGLNKNEMFITNINITKREEGIGSAVLLYLIKKAHSACRRVRFDRVENLEPIIKILHNESYENARAYFDEEEYVMLQDLDLDQSDQVLRIIVDI